MHLDTRTILQTGTEGSGLDPDLTWAQVSRPWASVEWLSGREMYLAQQVQPEVSTRVTIRYRTGVQTEQRLLVGMDATTLGAAITETDATTITVAADLAVSTSNAFRILVDDELMIVTAGHGSTTWTVTRGADGTTPATHDDASVVQHMRVMGIETVLPVLGRKRYLQLLCKEGE